MRTHKRLGATSQHSRGRRDAMVLKRTAPSPSWGTAVLVSSILAAAAMAGSVDAQNRAGKAPAPISGQTNASEVMRESRFAFMDLNKDGYVSRDEVPQQYRVLESMFSSLDEDDDGRLSEAEYVMNGDAPQVSGDVKG